MNRIVSQEQWLQARIALLQKEKAFTRQRDELNRQRRELPWVKVTSDYRFDSEQGPTSLDGLFRGHSQLIVYHFMFGSDWEEGCPGCSFWADNYNGTLEHLAARDIAFAVVSRGPVEKLLAYRQRMGWSFPWVSSAHCDFSFDFGVSFRDEELPPQQPNYNFGAQSFNEREAPGVSVFFRDEDGTVFHTYSCYARGLDILNGAYHHMDIAPRGRDEDALPHPHSWLRRHDQYHD